MLNAIISFLFLYNQYLLKQVDQLLLEFFNETRTIKRELIQDSHFEMPEQAQQEIFKYIELYCNTKKMHSSLGYLSPAQFEELNS